MGTDPTKGKFLPPRHGAPRSVAHRSGAPQAVCAGRNTMRGLTPHETDAPACVSRLNSPTLKEGPREGYCKFLDHKMGRNLIKLNETEMAKNYKK